MVAKNQTKSRRPKKITTPHLQKDELPLQVKSVFRDIGNSKGVIISKKLMDVAGILGNEIIIEAIEGEIRIRTVEEKTVNTDLSTWGKQFKAALKSGQEADADLFSGINNKFDEEEW